MTIHDTRKGRRLLGSNLEGKYLWLRMCPGFCSCRVTLTPYSKAFRRLNRPRRGNAWDLFCRHLKQEVVDECLVGLGCLFKVSGVRTSQATGRQWAIILSGLLVSENHWCSVGNCSILLSLRTVLAGIETMTRRLTTAQAIIQFLKVQFVSRDDTRNAFFAGCFGIFGHGNVAGIGQALQQNPDFPYYLCRNEQAMVHTAAAFAKMSDRLRALVCTTSIGPGATNMLTGAAGATINRLPVLLLPGDIFARRGVALGAEAGLGQLRELFGLVQESLEFARPTLKR